MSKQLNPIAEKAAEITRDLSISNIQLSQGHIDDSASFCVARFYSYVFKEIYKTLNNPEYMEENEE